MSGEAWWMVSGEGALDRDAIAGLLPHRGHMALLDSVVPVREGVMVGEVIIRADAFWAEGHFPAAAPPSGSGFVLGPIFPGVLMVESAAQLGICLWRSHLGRERTEGKLMVLKEVDKAVFAREARPGHRLRIKAAMEKCSTRFMRCAFEAVVLDDAACAAPCFSCHIAGFAV